MRASFDTREEIFGHSIVIGIALSAHGGENVELLEQPLVILAAVLNGAIGVVDEALDLAGTQLGKHSDVVDDLCSFICEGGLLWM